MKRTNEQIEKLVNERNPYDDITVLESDGAKGPIKVKCNRCGKIYSRSTGEGLYSNSRKRQAICRECSLRSKRKDRFEKKLRRRFPKDDLSVLSFNYFQDPGEIVCNKCGKVYSYKIIGSAFSKISDFFCHNCNHGKMEQRASSIKEFENFIQDSDDWILCEDIDVSKPISKHPVRCKCKYCGEYNYKSIYDYMRGRKCYCRVHNKPKTVKDVQDILGDDYKILSDLDEGVLTRIKVKHDICGFAYEVGVRNIIKGKGLCPRCSKRESAGERKVAKSLEELGVAYERQYKIVLNGCRIYVDFYLPNEDMFIEYNGIQHYEPVKMFGGKKAFQRQRKRDELEKEELGDSLIVISYKQDKDIDEILGKALKFNDYPDREYLASAGEMGDVCD